MECTLLAADCTLALFLMGPYVPLSRPYSHSKTGNVSVPGKVTHFRPALFSGCLVFFFAGGTVLFMICMKEVPAFPIIIIILAAGKKNG